MSRDEVRATIRSTFDEHGSVMTEASATLPGTIEAFVQTVLKCLDDGGKVLICGNGGSAADAQHLAAELVCRFRVERNAIAAVALTTDTSTLTAIANDYGYERVFARQVEALARPGDVLVAISTSGNSPNVLAAADQARSMGCPVVAMTGAGGGRLADRADLLVAAPSETVARIQEVHEIIIHVVAQCAEDAASAEAGS
jgi:D-sedoheptulose 7-phosphate isomerase